ncbi:MAG TPA: efflux RND transporter permease subunit [Planctomycetia bacterium]|nr:efflux RND transporter permease subunit [Planctomycetia bacterium]
MALAIRRRGWTLSLAIAVAIAGAFALVRTPIDVIPDLSENQQIVHADWPGRGPADIQAHLAAPLSRGLLGIAGLRTVRGVSEPGYAQIYLIFENGVGPAAARERIAERLESVAGLPPDVFPRLGPDGPATGQIFWYALEGGALDLGRRRALHDVQVVPGLASVEGVAEVASVGGFIEEIRVEIDPERLRSLGLDLVSAKDRIAQSAAVTSENLAKLPLPSAAGEPAFLGDAARVTHGPRPRRGMLEKDGDEAVGGIVLMRHGANPRTVTRRLLARVDELNAGLPAGVRIVPYYHRLPLIDGAIATLSGVIAEATTAAAIGVLLVLLHLRAALAVAAVLPLATLGTFLALDLLRRLGIADVEINVMSLAGIAVSVGVLVDASIVAVDASLVKLRERFGERPPPEAVADAVLDACRTIGRPIFYSVAIILLSFLPAFALGGIEGRMFAPLAATKSIAVALAAGFAITVVPALCAVLLGGRVRDESESAIVRSVAAVYRPALDFLIDRPGGIAFVVAATLAIAAPLFPSPLVPAGALGLGLGLVWFCSRTARTRWFGAAALLVVAAVAQSLIRPLETEFMTPLDERMTMDMPITIPSVTPAQAIDDLKARDMVLCRFPEVAMVVGKAGRAESPTDPAPLDMIETMVDFRPPEFWPRRWVRRADVDRAAGLALTTIAEFRLASVEAADREAVAGKAADAAARIVNPQLREAAHFEFQDWLREDRGVFDPANWKKKLPAFEIALERRAAALLARLLLEESLVRLSGADERVTSTLTRLRELRRQASAAESTPRHVHSHEPRSPAASAATLSGRGATSS